ncbi:MAG: molecular chaperone TorD family protein [Betaproteobacteria bacterium]|nr:molecular chaperone TorD family protein [Betaproteobacteria bacterium]
MINSEDLRDIAAGRAKTYAVLAALYAAPPAPELAATIRAGGLAQEPGSTLADAADELTECFRRAARDETGNEVVAEHTRLFVLPSGVVPHESYYLDENRRVGGHVTVAVERYYKAAAAQPTRARLELPDHMGVELEFMGFLCDIEAQLWQAANREGLEQCIAFQRGFLDTHLLRWHQALCQRIVDESPLDLYRALARLTVDFLEAERTYVPPLDEETCSKGRKACVCES